jgi:hypothetical protein
MDESNDLPKLRDDSPSKIKKYRKEEIAFEVN